MGLRLVLNNWSCIDFYSQTELDLESHSCIVSKQKYSFSSAQEVIDVMQRTSCILLTTIFQMQFCFTIVFPQTERGLCLSAVKPRLTSHACTKCQTRARWNLKFCTICMWQNMAMTKKWSGGSYSMRSPQAENHLAKANYFCVCMMLFSLPMCSIPCNRSHWALQAHRFSVPLAPCACLQHNRFCLVFSKDFNIMSGLSIHQPLTVPQKIDSREGLFHCK